MVDKNDEESFLDKQQQQEKRTKKWVSEKIYSPETLCKCNFVVRKCNFFWRQKDQVWDKKVSKRKKKKFQGERGRKWSKWHHSLVVDLPCPDIHNLWSTFLSLSFIWFSTWFNRDWIKPLSHPVSNAILLHHEILGQPFILTPLPSYRWVSLQNLNDYFDFSEGFETKLINLHLIINICLFSPFFLWINP